MAAKEIHNTMRVCGDLFGGRLAYEDGNGFLKEGDVPKGYGFGKVNRRERADSRVRRGEGNRSS